MKAKEFVLSKYPNATPFPMIDNRREQTSYVILKHGAYSTFSETGLDIFQNKGAKTASKAWANAKNEIFNNSVNK